jgi:hypothetical protein
MGMGRTWWMALRIQTLLGMAPSLLERTLPWPLVPLLLILKDYKNRMAAPKKYHSTAKSLMMWANSELEHVGRIAAVEDPDLQYSYAISTLNGMAHLKDALYEFVTERQGEPMTKDLKLIHDKVIRVMKHLIKDYKLNIQEIIQFNTKKVLSSLNYLKNAPKTNNKTRKNNKK